MSDINIFQIGAINNQTQAPAQAPKIAQDDYDASIFEGYFDAPQAENAAEDNFVGNFVEDFLGLFGIKPHEKTQDGTIDETNQHSTGDCWLLSGVNALSYTEEGQQIIKDALDYQDNGDIVVHFKGVGDYTVTADEIDNVRKNQMQGDGAYSTGDDDMLAFELGVEKVLADVAKHDIEFKASPGKLEDAASIKSDKNSDGTYIDKGDATQLMYLVTGKSAEYLDSKKDMESALDEFDGKTIALGAAIESNIDKTVKDVNGKDVQLPSAHAYAIKNVEGDEVTVVNPWDSGTEIVLSKDVFLDTFGSMQKCDLASEDVNYIKYPDEIDKDGNKTFRKEAPDFVTYSGVFGETIEPKYEQAIYDTDGYKIEDAYLDENGNKLKASEWGVNDNGVQYLKEQKSYFQDGTKSAGILYDKNGDFDSYVIQQYDESGEMKEMMFISSKETYNNLSSRNLFDYEQFSLEEIDFLAHFSNEEWEIAKDYLENNEDASYFDVAQEVRKTTDPEGYEIQKALKSGRDKKPTE